MSASGQEKWLVVLSGRSGAGKSVVLSQLEDLGFYCVDNLLSELIASLLERTVRSGHKIYNRVAIAVDARNLGGDDDQLVELLKACERDESMRTDIVYLDADDGVLLARFKETRRLHPLSRQGVDLSSALKRETALVEVIRNYSTLDIDTTGESVNGLRQRISDYFGAQRPTLSLSFCSFGFKNGIPDGVDMVFDVRCLPNPHWEQRLRSLSGNDKDVVDFLDAGDGVQELFADISQYLQKWLPKFFDSNRHYLTVGVGCTGGRHRSVYFCQRLYELFKSDYPGARVVHRDLQ